MKYWLKLVTFESEVDPASGDYCCGALDALRYPLDTLVDGESLMGARERRALWHGSCNHFRHAGLTTSRWMTSVQNAYLQLWCIWSLYSMTWRIFNINETSIPKWVLGFGVLECPWGVWKSFHADQSPSKARRSHNRSTVQVRQCMLSLKCQTTTRMKTLTPIQSGFESWRLLLQSKVVLGVDFLFQTIEEWNPLSLSH